MEAKVFQRAQCHTGENDSQCCKNLYKDRGLNLGSDGRRRFFSFEYPLMPSLSSFIFRGKHQAAFPFCPQNEGIVSSAFFPAWSKFSYGRGKICSISFYRGSRIRPLQHHCLINLIIPHLSLLCPWCQHPFQRQSHLPRSLSVPIQRWKRVFVVLTEVSPGIAPPVLPWSCDSG